MPFTIRDLLWLTLLAAVLVAWWVDRSRLRNDLEQLAKWMDYSGPLPLRNE
jgi:hypothetical protein